MHWLVPPRRHTSRSTSGVLVLALSGVLAISLVASPFGVSPTRALGNVIEVTTTADTEAPDGHCSLREAIKASNNAGWHFECQGSWAPTPFDSTSAPAPPSSISARDSQPSTRR